MEWETVVFLLGIWAGIVIVFAIGVHDKQDERRYEENQRRRGS